MAECECHKVQTIKIIIQKEHLNLNAGFNPHHD